MKKSILIIFVVASIAIGVIMVNKPKPVNCVVSETNPYESLPMVCKTVLQVPTK